MAVPQFVEHGLSIEALNINISGCKLYEYLSMVYVKNHVLSFPTDPGHLKHQICEDSVPAGQETYRKVWHDSLSIWTLSELLMKLKMILLFLLIFM
jgi:hypothetical protein